MDRILSFLGEHREEMIADLRRFVELETPSTDKSLLDGFAEFLAGYAETVQWCQDERANRGVT